MSEGKFSGLNIVSMHDSYAAVTMGYLSAGIAFGALAESLGVPYYFTAALSIFVYSGAVQSAFLGYWTIGIDPFSLVLTAFLLNLRHTFYGPHIQNQRPELEFTDIISLSPLLTDETYAISVSHPGLGKRGMQSIFVYAYILWVVGTLLGTFLLKIVPSDLIRAFALALPALFLGLLVPKVNHVEGLLVAVISGTIAVTGRLLGLSDAFLIVPILSGLIVGILLTRRRGENNV